MNKQSIRIAVIDDEKISAIHIQEHLADYGYPVDVFFQAEPFLESYMCSPYELVITDMKLPGIDGMGIIEQVKARHRETEIVVITGYATIDSAIEAIRAGAFHYLTKPIRLEEFSSLISQVIDKIFLRIEADNLRALMMREAGRDGMIGTSKQMVEVFKIIEKVAPLDCPVIIHGQSGTGKELVARAIHRLSPRCDDPIVSLNCGGFSPELIANELFGHEKAAFTGAFKAKKGLLESADKGIVLLDEITEMPWDMQVKLLRVIQEGQIYRIGATRPINIDIRILAASNRNLEEEVKKGKFREDLFFRLNVMTLSLPRLKDRQGDLLLLADHFLQKFSQAYNKKISGFSAKARDALAKYDYPGNVRELENIIARCVALTESDRIGESDLPPCLACDPPSLTNPLKSLKELEKDHIVKVLLAVDGQREQAARVLGVTRSTLWRKIKKLGLKI
ncbi:MAG: sigma-54-dependent Fis family transcriptional regulator [Deltaproteobacteria bacterium]|nr:sigma-54-dependent Fis family transcriptional regulator [Deltaproteobacteria bacterium]